MRTCKQCLLPKELVSFGKTGGSNKDGVPYRRRICDGCKLKNKRANNPERFLQKKRDKATARRRLRPWVTIVGDSKSSDKKHGRVGNDLDHGFVRIMLCKRCVYCGNDSIRMTLDRIDNSKAHMKGNVVPSCIRCNYIRGSMPYEAWMNIVPAIRDSFQKGLFGSWRTMPMVGKLDTNIRLC
jgi:hypothetical protein